MPLIRRAVSDEQRETHTIVWTVKTDTIVFLTPAVTK
jgi:hypothetical protein